MARHFSPMGFPPPGIRTTRPNCGWKRRKGRPSKATCRQPRKARRERSNGRREDMEETFQRSLFVGRCLVQEYLWCVEWVWNTCMDVIRIPASLKAINMHPCIYFNDRRHVAWIKVTTYDSSAEQYGTISLSTWPTLDWKLTFSLKHLMLPLSAQWFPFIQQSYLGIFWKYACPSLMNLGGTSVTDSPHFVVLSMAGLQMPRLQKAKVRRGHGVMNEASSWLHPLQSMSP